MPSRRKPAGHTVPHIPFADVAARIAYYWNPHRYNPHKGLLAPTRTGKSYLIRHGILPIIPGARVVVIDIKSGGEPTWDGWGNDVYALKPGFNKGDDGTCNYRVKLKPGKPKVQREQISDVLELIINEGECIVIMDDSKRITASGGLNLALASYVDTLLQECAATGVSAILAANSTNWAVSSLRDQCGVYFTGLIGNISERNEFADIIGLARNERDTLSTLAPREFLYSDRFSSGITTAITSLPE
jgi:hypothetical protein